MIGSHLPHSLIPSPTDSPNIHVLSLTLDNILRRVQSLKYRAVFLGRASEIWVTLPSSSSWTDPTLSPTPKFVSCGIDGRVSSTINPHFSLWFKLISPANEKRAADSHWPPLLFSGWVLATVDCAMLSEQYVRNDIHYSFTLHPRWPSKLHFFFANIFLCFFTRRVRRLDVFAHKDQGSHPQAL